MTSTGRGELTGRSSSRVLRPPGGGTSNIFGAADEPKPKPPTTTTTVSNNNDAIVESSQPETESQQDAEVHVAVAEAEAADEVVDADDEEQKEEEEDVEQVAAAAETNTNTVSVADITKPAKPVDAADIKKNQAIGFNPITGQPYNSNAQIQQDPVKAQIRVRQPPGGASTKLW